MAKKCQKSFGRDSRFTRIEGAVLLCLAALTLLCFWPCLHNGFTFWDDPTYLTKNMSLHHGGWSGVVGIFKETISKTYIPLSSLSYWIEFHFFGLNPFVYHLDNLLLHLANVVLVFSLVLKMHFSRRAAFIAALLFGIHPMHVEAVAWVRNSLQRSARSSKAATPNTCSCACIIIRSRSEAPSSKSHLTEIG